MIRIARDAWQLQSAALREKLKAHWEDLEYCNYKDLVELTMETLFNESDLLRLNLKGITEVDNGSYSGTLIYLIPFDVYAPSIYEYLMTYVEYGSCSGCDTLKAIQSDMWLQDRCEVEERVLDDFMKLCRDLVILLKPFYPHPYDTSFGEVRL